VELNFIEFKLVLEALNAHASYAMDRALSLPIPGETLVKDVTEVQAIVDRVAKIDAIVTRMYEQYNDRLEALDDDELDVACEHVTTQTLIDRLDMVFDKTAA
jgi:hypothetical protein